MDWADRFWAKVERGDADACWPWRGARFGNGYGKLVIAGKHEKAHRLAVALHGVDPTGLVVMHHCDNPPCVNPAHLSAVPAVENQHDCVRKRRHAWGERNGGAKLSRVQVDAIRRRYVRGRVRQVDLAAEYDVSQVLISKIVRGEIWDG